jgi:hypothetical protein
LLGIGAEGASEEVAWWKRDLGEMDEAEESAVSAAMPMTLGRQGRLFDADGAVSADVAGRARAATGVVGGAVAEEVRVSVRRKDARTARVVATTARAAAVPRAGAKVNGRRMVGRLDTAITKGAVAEGDIIRGLAMSQSISVSSGMEERRRFSVPRRFLLPRYQLMTGYEGVVADKQGGLRVARVPEAVRGRTLFG